MQLIGAPDSGVSVVTGPHVRVDPAGTVKLPAVLSAAVPPKLQAIVADALSLSIAKNSRGPAEAPSACAEAFVTVTDVIVRCEPLAAHAGTARVIAATIAAPNSRMRCPR
jgi:hypothetical protein